MKGFTAGMSAFFQYLAGLVVLGCSFAGYCCILRRFTNLSISFFPAIVFASVTLIGFMGGMAGFLNLSAYIIVAGGLICFIAVLVKWRGIFSVVATSPGIVFFTLMTLCDVVLFSNATLGHYDDFSHWGSIVRDMFDGNAFPSEGSIVSKVGSFTNYPPITATFIYVVNSAVGYTEGHAIVAQNLLLIAGATSLFSVIDCSCRRWMRIATISSCVGIAFASFWLIMNDNGLAQFQSLLVDSVMGLFAASALLVILWMQGKNILGSCLAALSLSLFVAFAKDNGKVFFVIIVLAIAVASFLHFRKCDASVRKSLMFSVVVGLAFLVIMLLLSVAWGAYVDAAYSSEEDGKFSVAVLLSGNSQMPLSEAVIRVVHDAFMADFQRSVVFFGLNALSLLVIALSHKKRVSVGNAGAVFFLSNAVIVGTCFALILLYAFAMPAAEDVEDELAGFSRYYGTALLAFYCIQWWGILFQANQFFSKGEGRCIKPGSACSVFLAVCLSACVLFSFPSLIVFWKGMGLEHLSVKNIVSSEYDYKRYPISSVLDDAQNYISPGQSIAVYYGDGALVGYHWFLSMYETNTEVYIIYDESSPEAISNALHNSDWLVFTGRGGDGLVRNYNQEFSVEDGPWFELQHTEEGETVLGKVRQA